MVDEFLNPTAESDAYRIYTRGGQFCRRTSDGVAGLTNRTVALTDHLRANSDLQLL